MAYLTDDQHAIVSDAVAKAEATTSGEIVTVLADRSDGYDDIVLMWAAGIAFSAMSLFAFLPQPFLDLWDSLIGGWTHEWTTGELATMTIMLGLIALLLSWFLLSLEAIKFRIVPGPVKTARVHARAIAYFKVGAERRTHGRTGVLIFLSMQEHRAEIVADRPIAEQVSADVWGEAMADMLADIGRGCVAEGMAAGVRDVGQVLAEHFPRTGEPVNELPDRLIEV
ncbi:hypothetical protein A9995_03550 [Erythrobacter sp. QSSC1-22B]|uniref:TPM domain-containing protein n=1 Tax=Erythrobacter sp. QSSC1-22B TaxID=1860125 RepID=UPI000804BE64|nr:hypothetical protein [Erythrobacter sp. QSSC1-22B]OBX20770.1 hypothetical protein A9995_03550 [Erythrobacter sp. QSSC1-22B]